jgi:hypothetical protein
MRLGANLRKLHWVQDVLKEWLVALCWLRAPIRSHMKEETSYGKP